MRVVQVAQDVEALARVGGLADAVAIAQTRAGSMYDPAVVAAFASDAPALFAALDGIDAWQAVLDAEPVPRRTVMSAALDDALLVLADYADLKSPYTGGHSRAVADLAAAAAASAGLDASLVTEARRAGLVHDLGTSGIPNSIWDKPGRLTAAEWERVRMHPYLTERIWVGRAPSPRSRRWRALITSGPTGPATTRPCPPRR